jgi:hypothetical protein
VRVRPVDQPTDHRAFEGAAAEVADVSESAGHIRVHVPEDQPKGLPVEGLGLACAVAVDVALAWARAGQSGGWRS